MKKLIAIVLSMVISTSLLVGCSSGNKPMKDGTYKAEFSEADEHGWTEYVEITVKNDKFTNVTFDAINDGVNEPDKKDVKKSKDIDYENAMKGAGSKTWPSDFYQKLATGLVDKQNVDSVDTVTGATTSTNNFKKLVKALTKNMEKGDTAVVKVEP